MNEDRPLPITGFEQPYQIVMVTVILELLALVVLAPHEVPTEPHVVAAVSGVRLLGLLLLGASLRFEPPRAAWPALAIWAALTWPPELWAHALEGSAARAILSGIGGLALALAMHTLARRFGRWWVVFGLVLIAPAILPLFQPTLPALEVWVLPTALIAVWGWWREARDSRHPHAHQEAR